MSDSRSIPWALALMLVLGLSAAACSDSGDSSDEGDGEDAALSEAVVDVDELTLDFDLSEQGGALTQALTGRPQALRDVVQARVTRTNQYVRALMGFIRDTVGTEPVVRKPGVRVWHVSKERAELTFAVGRRRGPNAAHFFYVLKAKPAGGRDQAYRAVMWGVFHKVAPHRGRGRMFLHFDRMKAIDPQFPVQGTAWLLFENLLPVKKITLLARNLAYQDEEPFSAAYQFGLTRAGVAGFRFFARADTRGGDARENLAVRAAWNVQGDGRADAVMWGGDLPVDEPIVGHECWSRDERTYLELSPDPDGLSFGTRDDCAAVFQEVLPGAPEPEDAAGSVEQPVQDDTFDIPEAPAEDEVEEEPEGLE